ILSPIVRGEKGTHKDKISDLIKNGYVRARIDSEEVDLHDEINLEKNKKHNIDVIVDRLVIKEEIRSRLHESIETASKLSNGRVIIDCVGDNEFIMSEHY